MDQKPSHANIEMYVDTRELACVLDTFYKSRSRLNVHIEVKGLTNKCKLVLHPQQKSLYDHYMEIFINSCKQK